MKLHNPFTVTNATSPDSGRTPKQKVLIDLHQLLGPEVFLVQNIRRINLRRHAAREVFDPLAAVATFDRRIVAMGFGVGFLEQREPCLVRIRALCKILTFQKGQPLGSAVFQQSKAISNEVSLPRHCCWTDKSCDRPPRYSHDQGRPIKFVHRWNRHSRAS